MGYGPLNTPSTAGSNCNNLVSASNSNLNRMRAQSETLITPHPTPPPCSDEWVKSPASDYQWHLRPIASYMTVKHGPDTPTRAKSVEWLWETVVVNDPSVDWEDSHEQDDVTAWKHHAEHLSQNNQRQIGSNQTCSSKQAKNKSTEATKPMHRSGAGESPVLIM